MLQHRPKMRRADDRGLLYASLRFVGSEIAESPAAAVKDEREKDETEILGGSFRGSMCSKIMKAAADSKSHIQDG